MAAGTAWASCKTGVSGGAYACSRQWDQKKGGSVEDQPFQIRHRSLPTIRDSEGSGLGLDKHVTDEQMEVLGQLRGLALKLKLEMALKAVRESQGRAAFIDLELRQWPSLRRLLTDFCCLGQGKFLTGIQDGRGLTALSVARAVLGKIDKAHLAGPKSSKTMAVDVHGGGHVHQCKHRCARPDHLAFAHASSIRRTTTRVPSKRA